MDQNDRTELSQFLEQFRALVDVAFEQNPGWFPDRLLASLRDAWRDLAPRFEQVEAAIQSPAYDRALDAAGLSGQQRQTKGAVWNAVYKAVENERQRRPRGGFLGLSGRLLRLFKIAMGVANTILESIGTAIPPAGAIKEFKGVFEGSLSLGEEQRGPVRRLLGRIF